MLIHLRTSKAGNAGFRRVKMHATVCHNDGNAIIIVSFLYGTICCIKIASYEVG